MNLLDYNLNQLPDHETLVSRDQYPQLLSQIDQWNIVEKDGVEQLICVYKCDDFVAAMDLAQTISKLAEQVDHHPALLIEWGKVSVSWWSHSLGGLHINDFIMAAYTQQLYSAQ
ncbi:MAG: 4a-hydroxytetrahydrobiopterin dehydratase [Porticoccaceae bacterium]